MRVLLTELAIDDSLRTRTVLDDDTISEYAAAMENGADFPPVVVFDDGKNKWLSDGFHRVEGARKAGKDTIEADVRKGTKRDAILYAVGANATHGLPRKNADKRRCVKMLLADDEWRKRSDNWIAEKCGVSNRFVGNVRRDLGFTLNGSKSRTGKDGRTTNTANIGTAQSDDGDSQSSSEPESSEPETESSEPESSESDFTKKDIDGLFDGDGSDASGDGDGQDNSTPETSSSAPPAKPAPKKFNRTNENVDWAPWTWNPVTGCEHNCPYCYAFDIAHRFFPDIGFKPTFHPERLVAPQNTKPQSGEFGENMVFVGSMCDLWGEWVSKDWIQPVLDAIIKAPQWTFLALTKNPSRYLEFDIPPNLCLGATVDTQERVGDTMEAFANLRAEGHEGVLFVSCEPLRGAVAFTPEHLGLLDWIIIGAQSKTSRVPAVQPDWDWVFRLLIMGRKYKVPVYMKPNLTVRAKETPDKMR